MECSANAKFYLTYYETGMVYLFEKKFDEALLMFNKAIFINPDRIIYYEKKSAVLFFLKQCINI